jgi:hypothetical protein
MAALGAASYTNGTKPALPFSSDPISVYDRAVRITSWLVLSEGVHQGAAELVLRLQTQACNDRFRREPNALELPIQIETVPGAPPAGIRHKPVLEMLGRTGATTK